MNKVLVICGLKMLSNSYYQHAMSGFKKMIFTSKREGLHNENLCQKIVTLFQSDSTDNFRMPQRHRNNAESRKFGAAQVEPERC